VKQFYTTSPDFLKAFWNRERDKEREGGREGVGKREMVMMVKVSDTHTL